MQASPMPAPLLLLRDHIPGEFLPGTMLYLTNRGSEFHLKTCFKFKNENSQVKPGARGTLLPKSNVSILDI